MWLVAIILDHTVTEAAAASKLFQSCLILCDPRDSSPPGSSLPGILQARTLEWVAISFSSAWKWKVNVNSLSCVWLFATPRTIAYQAPPSLGFSRQKYWSGVPLPSPGDLLGYIIISLWLETVHQSLRLGPHSPCWYYMTRTLWSQLVATRLNSWPGQSDPLILEFEIWSEAQSWRLAVSHLNGDFIDQTHNAL